MRSTAQHLLGPLSVRKSGPVDREVTQSTLGENCENNRQHTHTHTSVNWVHQSGEPIFVSGPTRRARPEPNGLSCFNTHPHICSVDMKVIHLSCGNLCLQLEMLILTFTETHIVVLCHNIFDLTGGAKIALVAPVGQTASLVRVLSPPSRISSRF